MRLFISPTHVCAADLIDSPLKPNPRYRAQVKREHELACLSGSCTHTPSDASASALFVFLSDVTCKPRLLEQEVVAA